MLIFVMSSLQSQNNICHIHATNSIDDVKMAKQNSLAKI